MIKQKFSTYLLSMCWFLGVIKDFSSTSDKTVANT